MYDEDFLRAWACMGGEGGWREKKGREFYHTANKNNNTLISSKDITLLTGMHSENKNINN